VNLTWKDIEAHRATLTATEWRRLSAYLRDGQEPSRIAEGEGSLREGCVRIASTTISESLGRGSLKVLLSLLRGPISWAEVKAHRGATTPQQWERIRLFVHEGRSMEQLGRQEGREPGNRTHTLRLSLGRGCLSLLNSMLGRPPRRGSGQPTFEIESIPATRDTASTTAKEVESRKGLNASPMRKTRRRKKRHRQPEKRWLDPTLTGKTSVPVSHADNAAGTLAQALQTALATQATVTEVVPQGSPEGSSAPVETAAQSEQGP